MPTDCDRRSLAWQSVGASSLVQMRQRQIHHAFTNSVKPPSSSLTLSIEPPKPKQASTSTDSTQPNQTKNIMSSSRNLTSSVNMNDGSISTAFSKPKPPRQSVCSRITEETASSRQKITQKSKSSQILPSKGKFTANKSEHVEGSSPKKFVTKTGVFFLRFICFHLDANWLGSNFLRVLMRCLCLPQQNTAWQSKRSTTQEIKLPTTRQALA